MGLIKRIGFDIDDTLTDGEDFFIDRFKHWYKYVLHHGEYSGLYKPENYDFKKRVTGIHEHEYKAFNNWYFPKLVNEAPFRPGVQELFKDLKELGYEIVIVTRRDDKFSSPTTNYDGACMKADTLDRFRGENLEPDKFYFGCNDKLKTMIDHDIDIMVEDAPMNIDKIIERKGCIIMKAPWNATYPNSKKVVKIDHFEINDFMKAIHTLEESNESI